MAPYSYLNDTMMSQKCSNPTRFQFPPLTYSQDYEPSSNYEPTPLLPHQLSQPSCCLNLHHTQLLSLRSSSCSAPSSSPTSHVGEKYIDGGLVYERDLGVVREKELNTLVNSIRAGDSLASGYTTNMQCLCSTSGSCARNILQLSNPLLDTVNEDSFGLMFNDVKNKTPAPIFHPDSGSHGTGCVSGYESCTSTDSFTPTSYKSCNTFSRKRNICSSCNMTFARKYDLERHTQNQHRGGKLGCGNCGRRFRKDKLKKHMQGCLMKGFEGSC